MSVDNGQLSGFLSALQLHTALFREARFAVPILLLRRGRIQAPPDDSISGSLTLRVKPGGGAFM